MKVSFLSLLPLYSWKDISVAIIFFALSANVLVIFGQYPVCNSFTSQTELKSERHLNINSHGNLGESSTKWKRMLALGYKLQIGCLLGC